MIRKKRMKIVNFGSLNIDYRFCVEQIVRPGQTIDSNAEERLPGGKGLNQSLAIARAGVHVYHAGMYGEDGRFLKDLLESEGVDCRFLNMVAGGTGKAFIQVEASGQNSIVLSGGANRKISRGFCDQTLAAFDPGDILLLQNEINGIDYLIEKASGKGMVVALNPSPMNDAVLACDLSRVSFFIMNEDEGMKVTRKEGYEAILNEMEQRYPEAKVVLTLGEKGAVFAYKKERIYQGVYLVQAVDTTGAGDTFTGYLLAGIVQGTAISECLKQAAMASSIAVTRKGAAMAIPYRKEVLYE